jgi:DNA-binding NtrC family response regulator
MIDQNVHLDIPVILSASPSVEDHRRLAEILEPSDLSPRIQSAQSVDEAVAIAKRALVPVAIVERDLPGGAWQSFLERIQQISPRPLLVVTSLQADDYLWAEALNIGAFDVLAKPFASAEVTRVVSWACLRWCEMNRTAARHHKPRKFCASVGAGSRITDRLALTFAGS